MKSFQYATATSPATARELLGENGRYLAGGIDLLGEMKEYIAEPRILVNVKALPNLDKIEPGIQSWSIGANVKIAQLENHSELKTTFPGLQQAAAEVGSQQIRNVATVGGNLAQHSRCWYYRHRDILCLKKGGDTCYARHGDNKYHSLFTGNTCISPVVSNLSVILAALDASVIVQRGDKPVRMSIAEFYAKAWENPTAHHSLEPGDLVFKVELPLQQRRSIYLQVSEKSMFDWALVSCAAAARIDGGKFTHARVVLGAVANVPYQVQAANALLEGQVPDDALAGKVADAILEKAQPHSDNGYKIQIARTLIRRSLAQLKAQL
jgi:xanthine dehydrogenase YagS FAD-binding subunit